ncbi:MAG: putative nucleotide-diphospho-sugar transferase [Parvibaculum sp.]
MTTILSFVNAPYLPLLDLWMRQSRGHMETDPTIVCTDASAYDHCKNTPGLIAERGADRDWSSRPAFWKSRFAVLRDHLEKGTAIIHTDLDAFWCGPVIPFLGSIGEDLVFSREFGLPKHIVAKWGFVLCCGFFQAKPTPGARAFFRLWQKHVEKHGDDQVALNTLLAARGVTWTKVPCGGHMAERCELDLEGETVSILALPYEIFSRKTPFLADGELVAHPFFEKEHFASFMKIYARVLNRDDRLDAVKVPETFLKDAPAAMKTRDVATLYVMRGLMDDMDAQMWGHRADLEARYGNATAAAQAVERALEWAPDDPQLLVTAAEIHLQNGETGTAQSRLLRLETSTVTNPGDRFRLRHLSALWRAGMKAEFLKKIREKAYFRDAARSLARRLRQRIFQN